MIDPTNLASFDLSTFDPVARPRRQASARPAPAAPRPKAAAAPAQKPVAARLEPAAPSVDPAEVAALQAELAALRAEVQALRDAPATEARRKALAEAWVADLTWRGREGGRRL
ncbi:hypothetical protein [Paenirhodobacter sp.]|uniref:hypothetical protein n=1 Tax=Paenirhodobacter sp. TaxID=1965326 RepID=UPI003B3C4D44